MTPSNVNSIIVLGGGSAGFMAAITLKRKLPHLAVRVIRSPDIGVIGVGEGTTIAFPKHFFEYLRLKPMQFYAQAEPTWKLGIKFLWGPRREFYYTFSYEFQQRFPELSRNSGFFYSDEYDFAGRASAFMARDKAFPRQPDGTPQFHNNHAYHIENQKLVAWLENVAREFGVEIQDATVTCGARQRRHRSAYHGRWRAPHRGFVCRCLRLSQRIARSHAGRAAPQLHRRALLRPRRHRWLVAHG